MSTINQANEYFNFIKTILDKGPFDLANMKEDNSGQKSQDMKLLLDLSSAASNFYMKYLLSTFQIDLKNIKTLPDEPQFAEFKSLLDRLFCSYYEFSYPTMISISKNGGVNEEVLESIIKPKKDVEITPTLSENIDNTVGNYMKLLNHSVDYKVNFEDVYRFLNFLNFFAKFISKNGKDFDDFDIAYIKTMLSEELISKYLKEAEEKSWIADSKINSDLLAYILTHNINLTDIEDLVKLDYSLVKSNNLYQILSKKIPVDTIKKGREKGISTMLLLSGFKLEQISKIISIPVVGEYMNQNERILNGMITDEMAYIGLSFEQWYEILSLEEIKNNLEVLEPLVKNYSAIYSEIIHNSYFTTLFKKRKEEGNLFYIRPSKNNMFERIKNNIKKNIHYFENKNISLKNIPVMMDHENILKILELLNEKKVPIFQTNLFLYPYCEIESVINYMIKQNIPIQKDNRFSKDEFSDIYKKNSIFNPLLDTFSLTNEFICKYGSYRQQMVIFATFEIDEPNNKKL